MIIVNRTSFLIFSIFLCYLLSCLCQATDLSPNETLFDVKENMSANTSSANVTKKFAVCKRPDEDKLSEVVSIVDYINLLEILTSDPDITSRTTEAPCALVMFYSPVCPFSCSAAPHYNALPRAFPDIKIYAIDSRKYHSINTQYAIVGVPTILFFHNARPIAKFNRTEYNVNEFAKFIKSCTDIDSQELVVQTKDFQGPVPSVMEKEIDYYLILSWIFVIISSMYFFGKSPLWKRIVEMIQNTWREAAGQHEHLD